MNKEEIQAIERCENFSINVLVEHPDIYGSRWLVQEDIKSIKAVKTLLRLYRQLEQENKELKEELQKADSITQSCIFNGKKESEISYRIALNLVEQLRNENKELKAYIKELEENSGVLVSQVESWSKTADIYLEKYQELHNKIDKYKDLEQSLTFIKNRVKQGMTQENVNKCAIQLVNSYLKDSDVDEL